MNVARSVIVSALLLSILSVVAISQVFSVPPDGANPFDMIWEAIEDLQTQIDEIELLPGPQGPIGPQGPPGPPGGFGEPDYDSGWRWIDPGDSHDLDHGLGADGSQFFIYMIGRYDMLPENPTPSYCYHQFSGAYWRVSQYLPPNQPEIVVWRSVDDIAWEWYRIYIWVIP